LLICSKLREAEQAEYWASWIMDWLNIVASWMLPCLQKKIVNAVQILCNKLCLNQNDVLMPGCWCCFFWLFSWICYALYKKSQIIFGISSVCCFARVLKLKLNTDWNDEKREEEETGQRKKHKVTNHEQRNTDLSENFKFLLNFENGFLRDQIERGVSVCVTGAINDFFFKFRGILVGHYWKGYYFYKVVAIPFYTIVFCR